DNLTITAIDAKIEQHQVGDRVKVPIIAGNFLVVPDELAGGASDGNNAVRVQIVAGTSMHVGPGAGLSSADIDNVVVAIVSHTVPYRTASADLPPLIAPRFCSGLERRILERLGWISRNRVEAPCEFAVVDIVCREESADRVLAAADADNDLSTFDDSRRH